MNHTNTCLCHLQFVWTALQPIHSSVSQMLKLGKVPQPTKFGGQGIRLGHRAMDLSWVHSLLALVHFASAPILALVILQHSFVGISATVGAGWGFLLCAIAPNPNSSRKAPNRLCHELPPGGCPHTKAQEQLRNQLPPLLQGKHQGSAATLHIPQAVLC